MPRRDDIHGVDVVGRFVVHVRRPSSSESGAGAVEEPASAQTARRQDAHDRGWRQPDQVANANDVTVAELQAANEDNGRVWNSFPIGSKLYLPC